jgi:formylglycine-generating enzyme required for sulfatase activity
LNCVNARPFPWGDSWAPGLANAGGGAREIAPPGSFPADSSPEGVGDLAGNVFEWTASDVPGDPTRRIVKGSAWSAREEFRGVPLAHLATRATEAASVRFASIGFRCARDFEGGTLFERK